LGLAGPVGGVHQNVWMVGGGANFPDSMPWLGGKKKYYNELYVFKKDHKKNILYSKSFQLLFSIAYAASCSTPQGVLYAGGENEEGISNKATLLQWDPVAENINTKRLPDLPEAVTNAAATINGNTVYVAGGETAAGVSDRFYCLDLNNLAAGWQQLPAIPHSVSHTVLIAQSNGDHTCIYVIGGRKKNTNGISDLYASVYEFDLVTQQWKEKKSLPYNLSAGTAIAAGPGSIVLFGGDKGETFHQAEILIAAINAEKDEAKKAILIGQKNKLQATHPGFSKEVLLYNTIKDEWTVAGNIPYETPVTTTAFTFDNEVLIPGGEIKAGVRTPHILAAKLNFKTK